MIDTSALKYGDVCLVSLENEGTVTRNILCVFINGAFQNIEESHIYEVYGSSVYKFKKLQSLDKSITILHGFARNAVRGKRVLRTYKNRRCHFCEKFDVCKYIEELHETSLSMNIEINDEEAFRRWMDHYAKYCMNFKLDEIEVEGLMRNGLITVFEEQPRGLGGE